MTVYQLHALAMNPDDKVPSLRAMNNGSLIFTTERGALKYLHTFSLYSYIIGNSSIVSVNTM